MGYDGEVKPFLSQSLYFVYGKSPLDMAQEMKDQPLLQALGYQRDSS
jgi:hypothetical protein